MRRCGTIKSTRCRSKWPISTRRGGVCAHAGPDCRIAAGFGFGASGPGARRTYRVARARRSSARCGRSRRRHDRRVSGTSSHDIDVSAHQSIAVDFVAGRRRGKDRHATAFARGGSRHSCRTHCAGSSDPVCRPGRGSQSARVAAAELIGDRQPWLLPCPPYIWRVTARPNGR